MVTSIELRELGNSGIKVSALGFGGFAIAGNRTGNSYGPTVDDVSLSAVRAAVDQGCTLFDTADVYGFGKGEVILQKGLGSHSNNVVIATKVGGRFDNGIVRPDHSRDYILASIDSSLRRLKRDYVDVYYLHDPPLDVIEQGQAIRAMEDLVASGKIRVAGASIHTLEEATACIQAQKISVLQVPYNLFSLLQGDTGWEQVFAQAHAQGVGIVVREPLASGFLSGRHSDQTTYGPGDNRGRLSPARRKLLCAMARSIDRLAIGNTSLAQVSLRFVLDEPYVSSVIVGMKTVNQVVENFASLKLPVFSDLECLSAESDNMIEV